METTQTQKIVCDNLVKTDDNAVFCARVDRWINAVYCQKCSPERKKREEYEW
jgi:hypothetical protein